LLFFLEFCCFSPQSTLRPPLPACCVPETVLHQKNVNVTTLPHPTRNRAAFLEARAMSLAGANRVARRRKLFKTPIRPPRLPKSCQTIPAVARLPSRHPRECVKRLQAAQNQSAHSSSKSEN